MIQGAKRKQTIHDPSVPWALAAGFLFELELDFCRGAGYRWPVRVARDVALLLAPTPQEERLGHTFERRMGRLLWRAREAILRAGPGDTVAPFELPLGEGTITLWARLDETRGPAIHILPPETY